MCGGPRPGASQNSLWRVHFKFTVGNKLTPTRSSRLAQAYHSAHLPRAVVFALGPVFRARPDRVLGSPASAFPEQHPFPPISTARRNRSQQHPGKRPLVVVSARLPEHYFIDWAKSAWASGDPLPEARLVPHYFQGKHATHFKLLRLRCR